MNHRIYREAVCCYVDATPCNRVCSYFIRVFLALVWCIRWAMPKAMSTFSSLCEPRDFRVTDLSDPLRAVRGSLVFAHGVNAHQTTVSDIRYGYPTALHPSPNVYAPVPLARADEKNKRYVSIECIAYYCMPALALRAYAHSLRSSYTVMRCLIDSRPGRNGFV